VHASYLIKQQDVRGVQQQSRQGHTPTLTTTKGRNLQGMALALFLKGHLRLKASFKGN